MATHVLPINKDTVDSSVDRRGDIRRRAIADHDCFRLIHAAAFGKGNFNQARIGLADAFFAADDNVIQQWREHAPEKSVALDDAVTITDQRRKNASAPGMRSACVPR